MKGTLCSRIWNWFPLSGGVSWWRELDKTKPQLMWVCLCVCGFLKSSFIRSKTTSKQAIWVFFARNTIYIRKRQHTFVCSAIWHLFGGISSFVLIKVISDFRKCTCIPKMLLVHSDWRVENLPTFRAFTRIATADAVAHRSENKSVNLQITLN